MLLSAGRRWGRRGSFGGIVANSGVSWLCKRGRPFVFIGRCRLRCAVTRELPSLRVLGRLGSEHWKCCRNAPSDESRCDLLPLGPFVRNHIVNSDFLCSISVGARSIVLTTPEVLLYEEHTHWD